MIKDYVDLRRNEKFERKINVSFIELHRFLIKLNGKKILVLYFDEDNMFLYNRKMPIDMKKLNLILDTMKEAV